jgi:3-hydroxyisobutyrate dehydrogenase-like beta-hydroxyacid dehydrogenase
MSRRIALMGLGQMGRPIARHLAAKGEGADTGPGPSSPATRAGSESIATTVSAPSPFAARWRAIGRIGAADAVSR